MQLLLRVIACCCVFSHCYSLGFLTKLSQQCHFLSETHLVSVKEIQELELAESIFNISIRWMHLKSTVLFVLVNYLQEINNNVTKILTS